MYHLLGDDLWDLVHQVKGELNGASVLVLRLQLFGVLDPELEGNGRLFAVVLLVELHPHARVLGKKGVIQEVFDGIPARCTHKHRLWDLHRKVTTDLMTRNTHKAQLCVRAK